MTEQTQKVLDTINQLQLSQALCGVVRYPNTFAYNAGPSPFCGNGCCGTAHMICGLARDVDDECKYADRLALSLSAVDYDMQVIVPMQHELHEKYRKKLHDVGKKLS